MKQPFLKRFQHFLGQHDLVRPGDGVLVAVSGGPDSMALLHCLVQIQDEWHLRFSVAHVHHGLRGEDADQDEQFVRNHARMLGLPFYGSRVDVPTFAKQTKRSIEDSARVLRYQALESFRKRAGFQFIALGHHANDQAETILLNLFRGAGIRGIGGMSPARGRLIRPLLFATRDEIKNFIGEAGIPSRFDASNQERRFLRNRLRLDVMPVIQQSFGREVVHTLGRTGTAAREMDTFLRAETEKAWPQVVAEETPSEITLEIDSFLRYFKIIQKSIAALAAEKLTGVSSFFSAADYQRVIDLVQNPKSGATVLFHETLRVIRSSSVLIFTKQTAQISDYPIQKNRETRIPELGIKVRVTELGSEIPQDLKQHNHETEYVDGDKIDAPLIVRSRRPGDSFIPLGMIGHKKVHDYFVDEKIPNYKRRTIPLLCCGDKIVWIAGCRLDDRFKVTSQTKRILKLEILCDKD